MQWLNTKTKYFYPNVLQYLIIKIKIRLFPIVHVWVRMFLDWKSGKAQHTVAEIEINSLRLKIR